MSEENRKIEELSEERPSAEDSPEESPKGGVPLEEDPLADLNTPPEEPDDLGAPEEPPREPPKEPPEELLRALEAEVKEEEEPVEETPAPKSLWSWWPLAGIAICILGILGAIYTFWRLTHPSKEVTVVVAAPSPGRESSEVSSPPLTESAREPLGSLPTKLPTEYSLVLKHFLIPLQSEGGAPVFVKATVVLYFEDQKEVLLARKLETPYRGIIFETFKNIPFYYWRSKEGVSKIKKVLKEALKKKAPQGLVPKDIEVTGYILK